MPEPETMSVDELMDEPTDTTEVWVTPSARDFAEQALPFTIGTPTEPSSRTNQIIAIGGGTLIDQAKAWRADHSPSTKLIAVPSIWGSGAEVSPVVVENSGGRKCTRLDSRFLPDRVVYWHDLADSIGDDFARYACGDVWAHALEGFLSPLSNDELRKETAILISDMLATPLGKHTKWFSLSAAACAAQSRSSVGLVHGIAHTLELPLRSEYTQSGWGHAKLCSCFLLPVLSFDMEADGKARRLFSDYGLDIASIIEVARELYSSDSYRQAIPYLTSEWRNVLRDQCSRTNVRLVRPRDIEFFEQWECE